MEALAKGLQVSEENPIAGLEGRSSLLINLGKALDKQEIFGVDSRPGNMLGMMFLNGSHSTLLMNSLVRLLDEP